MKLHDIISIAFSNFRRRKLRSVLTVLGVVIGTTSIVVMISLGIAVKLSFQQSIESMGNMNTISVTPKYDPTKPNAEPAFNDEQVESIKKLDNVTTVSPQIQLNGKMVSGKYVSYTNVIGIDAATLEALSFKTEQGNLLDPSYKSNKNIQCVFGSQVAASFYNPKKQNSNMSGSVMGGDMGGKEEKPIALIDPMDSKSKIKFTFDYSYGEPSHGDPTANARKPILYDLQNVGILKQELGERDNTVYIDITSAKKLKKEYAKQNQQDNSGGIAKPSSNKKSNGDYNQMKVMTSSIEHTIAVTEAIRKLGFDASSNAEWINTQNQQSQLIQLILGGIGSIALLVAAIGITNTMIMSIYERTREIGVMKVIGCTLKDIGRMFLFEAAFIGLFGGGVGLILSYIVSFGLNMVGSSQMSGIIGGGGDGFTKLSVIEPWLAICAVVFSILIGVLAGFLPARRAMKLSALEAMRN